MAKKHGHRKGYAKTPTYMSWTKMKERCLNPNHVRFASYGGRGILITEKWMKFEGFLEDMGTRPDGKTIDRINVDGHYEPDNCRWASDKTQARNRRKSDNE